MKVHVWGFNDLAENAEHVLMITYFSVLKRRECVIFGGKKVCIYSNYIYPRHSPV